MKGTHLGCGFAAAVVFAASLFAQTLQVTKEELPPAVANTLEKRGPGSTFADAAKQTAKDGSVTYVVNTRQGEKSFRFVVTPEGKLVDTRESQTISEVPEAVRKTILTGALGEPEKLTKITLPPDAPFYRFVVNKSIALDGTVSSGGIFGKYEKIEKKDLPQPIVDAFGKLYASSEWGSFRVDPGPNSKYRKLCYQVRVNKGDDLWFFFSPEGVLLEKWDWNAKLADAPVPVAKTIENAAVGAPVNLAKMMPVGRDPSYLFTAIRDVAEDGALITKKNQ